MWYTIIGVNRLYSRYLCYIVIAVAVLAMVGCESNRVDELIKQSPFIGRGENQQRSVEITTCTVRSFELPADVDLSETEFWSQLGSVNPSAKSGCLWPTRQVGTWEANGFRVTAAPLANWAPLRDLLRRVGAKSLPENWAAMRGPSQVLETTARHVKDDVDVFVSEPDGSLRGYRLGQGDCIVQIHVGPTEAPDGSVRLNVRMVPVFRWAQARQSYSRTESGGIRRVEEKPEIVFDQMLLSVILEGDSFVCLAAGPNRGTPAELGRLFLGPPAAVENGQVILVIVPSLRVAEEAKQPVSAE